MKENSKTEARTRFEKNTSRHRPREHRLRTRRPRLMGILRCTGISAGTRGLSRWIGGTFTQRIRRGNGIAQGNARPAPRPRRVLRPGQHCYRCPAPRRMQSRLLQTCKKKRRNEVGQYEDFEQYEIHDENFPVGHGEKSVILLLQSGLDLKDDEIYAIRWHMGPWNLSRDDEKFYRQSGKITPLQPLIHAADTLASAIIERPGKKFKHVQHYESSTYKKRLKFSQKKL